ncbi:hypothetical protein PHET_08014 [Paragonimus heterotremus]|uniref:Importin N-terminal domain-containing protein n=1 Tax=Paragonimus heterotremus TaxID=100268 RepID=A0A8J4SKD7_9TREM|nr:hypothetical protein PHET_08014 [Paragonimus heterotremus]
MDSSLVGLLNSAASADPTVVVAAGQQLISLTSNYGASNSTFANLACVVFSDSGSQLTLDGRFVGLIHLKNAMFDARIWQNLHPSERVLVRDRLLAYLASGRMPSTHPNKVEQLPRIGPCVAELVARLVRNEWLKDGWTDEFWDRLISWSAWASLRAALRAAASFRLPARRRAFLQLVRMLLPKVINLWKMVISTPEIESCIRLSLLLHTCIVSVGGDPLYGPFLFADEYGSFASTIFEGILLSLDKLLECCQESNGSADPARLLRRMCKLLLVLFISCSSAVRDQFVRPVLVHVVQLITSYPLSIGALKGFDERSATWLLALLYGIQSALVPNCRSRFPLNEKGVDEVKTWMFTPLATDNGAELTSVHLSHMLFVLLQYWFPLSSNEKRCLVTDPEGCLASGGSSGTDGPSYSSPSTTAHITSALAIWDADSQARELAKLDVPTLLGFQGSELQIHMFQPCRQLVELLVTLVVREFGDETRTLLFHVVTNMQQHATNCDHYETVMRLVQLCLPYVSLDPRWCSLGDSLVTTGLQIIDSHLTVNEGTPDPDMVVFCTRVLCLLVRCAVYGTSHSLGSSSLEQRCTAAVVQLIRFLNRCSDMISPSSASVKSALCLRLSAANALSWMLDQPLPSGEYLTTHLSPLFNSLVELIQDVSECETRIFLLGILCKLIEVAEMSGCPQLANQLLNLLDRLWHLDTQSAALRAKILDAICLLLVPLNWCADADDQTIALRTSLQTPIASLIMAAIRASDTSGADALFDPGLRLWASFVTGDEACWSPAVDSLMAVLVGQPGLLDSNGDQFTQPDHVEPLLNRLETGEQTELFLKIVRGSLILACRAGREQAITFLRRWTEPFWSTVWHAYTTNTQFSTDGHTSRTQNRLDYLYSSTAAVGFADVDEAASDAESPCRIKQLSLLANWLSIFLDIAGDSATHVVRLTPSLIGLLLASAQRSLKTAPVEAHNDVCPLATQLRLGLLARLAISKRHWLIFLHILHCMHTVPGPTQNAVIQTLTSTRLDSLSPPAVENGAQLCELVLLALERWLARADSLTDTVDRRCYAVACLVSLTYCAQFSVSSGIDFSADTDQLEHWAVADTVHSRWLEPVINLCIDVLHETDRTDPGYTSVCHFPHPQGLETHAGLVQRLRNELTAWQQAVDDNTLYAEALFRCHVDPVLRTQLETVLSV